MKITVKNNQVVTVYDNDAKLDNVGSGLYVIFVPNNNLKPKMVKREFVVPVFDPNDFSKKRIETSWEQDGYIYPWVDGEWNENVRMASIRLQRDYLLGESDWIVSKYAETLTEVPQNWRNYRQALRDFPSTVDVNLPIEQIVWPVSP